MDLIQIFSAGISAFQAIDNSVISALTVIFLFFSSVFLWTLKNGKIKIPFFKRNKKLSLKYSVFFNTMENVINVELPVMEVCKGKPVRNELFKDILKILVQTYYAGFKDIIETDMSDWGNEKWASEIKNRINDMVIGFEERAKIEGIPDIVIHKFKQWNHNTMIIIHSHISVVSGSEIYKTNYSKTSTFLLLMNITIISMLGDAERSLTTLNGQLTGKMYKGKPIE